MSTLEPAPLLSLRAVTKSVTVDGVGGIGPGGRAARTIQILDGVDLQVGVQDYVAITGPSGSGKSTLLNILGLLDAHDGGSYRFLGREVGLLSSAQQAAIRASDIGFVFQAFHLLPHRTIVDNVMMAGLYTSRPAISAEQAMMALERVGLHDRGDEFPSVLSGGERQRVAVARAIVKRPRVLLADEPTGNLDSVATGTLLDLFDEIHDNGGTIVVVTHDPEVAERARRRVHLDDGVTVHEPMSEPTPDPSTPTPTRIRSGPALAKGPATLVESAEGSVTSRLPLRRLLNEAIVGIASRPSRAVLTGVGTVLGVAALVATLGMGATTGNRIVNRFNELTATEVIAEPSRGDAAAALPWGSSERIERLNGVVAAGTVSTVDPAAVIRTVTTIDPNRRDQTANLVAVSPGLFAAVRAEVATGRLFNRIHERRADRIVVLGPRLADRLGIGDLRLATTVFIDQTPFVVAGVLSLEAGERSPELLTAAIIPEATARRDFDLKAPWRVQIDTEVGAAAQVAVEAPLILRPDDPTTVRILRAETPTRLREEVRRDLNGLVLALGSLSLLVGGLGIANLTLISVLERSSEIGLRRALGARPRHSAIQFLAEAGLIGALAGLVGMAVGTGVIVMVSVARQWTPVVDPRVIIAAPALGGLVGMAAGIYPSLRAARIVPAETLRAGL